MCGEACGGVVVGCGGGVVVCVCVCVCVCVWWGDRISLFAFLQLSIAGRVPFALTAVILPNQPSNQPAYPVVPFQTCPENPDDVTRSHT